MTTANDRAVLVQGLAAYAVTLSSMGRSEADARAGLRGLLLWAGDPDVQLVRDAAAAVGQLPTPLDEPADVLERRESIRRMLGVPEVATELTAQLRAREWLQRLADDLDR